MKLYPSRKNSTYLTELKDRLSPSGKRGLFNTAIEIDPRKYNGRVFDKQIRIDFFGISALNLLDERDKEKNAYSEFRDLLSSLEDYNKKGIRVKIRFLFLYPYSTYAHSLMNAEATENRSAINNPKVKPDYRDIATLNSHEFVSSSFSRNQVQSLKTIQILIKRINKKRVADGLSKISPKSENQLLVRFTPIAPCFCGLIINSIAFYDNYQFSKIYKDDSKLAYFSPLIKVKKRKEGKDERKLFCCLADHFRYLWRHYTSLDLEDATHFTYNGKALRSSMSMIKEPDQINYAYKKGRLTKQYSKAKKLDAKNLDKDLAKFQLLANNMLARLTDYPNKIVGTETLFITCSWSKRDDNSSAPIADAESVESWLNEDFKNDVNNSLLNIDLYKGKIGSKLSSPLYARMNKATLSLVFISNDIEDESSKKKYSRPNMYHELGYMMKQLQEGRIYLQTEKGVETGSNVNDLVRGDSYTPGKISLNYVAILDWIRDNTNVVDDAEMFVALTNHSKRLNSLFKAKVISSKELKIALSKIAYIKSKLKILK